LQFALVNNQRVPAEPKLKGLCPGCGQPVTAKCGTRRIWHWAHDTERICDNWWEPETEWHRAWKNNYPPEWQEIVKHDGQSSEKHIADVCTSHDLVIEFQHSHLDPQERAARERFYQNMVWVVDGTRLKRDYARFLKGKHNLRPYAKDGVFLLYFEECLPANWLESSVPVFFDFRGVAQTDSPDQNCEPLWCLLPGRAEGNAVLIAITYTGFVERSSSRSQLLPAQQIVSSFREHIRQQRAKDDMERLEELRRQEMKMQSKRPWRRRTSSRF
jgi:hypothetical protein